MKHVRGFLSLAIAASGINRGEREFTTLSAAYVVSAMVPPIIAPARPRRVSDKRASCGTNQSASNCSPRRSANQAADKRATATANQCAAQDAIIPPVRAPSERQRYGNNDQNVTHRRHLSNMLRTQWPDFSIGQNNVMEGLTRGMLVPTMADIKSVARRPHDAWACRRGHVPGPSARLGLPGILGRQDLGPGGSRAFNFPP